MLQIKSNCKQIKNKKESKFVKNIFKKTISEKIRLCKPCRDKKNIFSIHPHTHTLSIFFIISSFQKQKMSELVKPPITTHKKWNNKKTANWYIDNKQKII